MHVSAELYTNTVVDEVIVSKDDFDEFVEFKSLAVDETEIRVGTDRSTISISEDTSASVNISIDDQDIKELRNGFLRGGSFLLENSGGCDVRVDYCDSSLSHLTRTYFEDPRRTAEELRDHFTGIGW